jgi:hypothetical protein
VGSRKEVTVAIALAFMGLLAGLVFESAAATSRAYEAAVDRYLERRRFFVPRQTHPRRAR